VRSLSQRQLVRGKVSAVDGSGLGDDFRLVALGGVSASRPIIVAWRLLSGPASQKGKEAAVTRQLIEQVLEVAGPQAIGLLLADALYADGPLLAWLKYRQGIDAQVALARGPSALPGEDETYRELKEGWEQQRWGRDFAAALGRTTLTCLAFKTAQVSRLPAGERLASVAMRRLHQRELGTAPRESLLPAVRTPSASDAPT